MKKKGPLKTYRRCFQVFIAVVFIVIPIANRSDYSYVYGNYLAFHLLGIPFADPLAVLQLTLKNHYITLENTIGALVPLLLAFALGTVFCSWLCVYGLLSEWTHQLSKKLLPPGYRGLPLGRPGFPFKMGVFVAGFIGFFVFSTTPILNQLSLAAWYSRFFQYLFGQDVVSLCFLFLLALLCIEFLARKRLWCRYVCPQSVLIILAKQLGRKRMRVAFAEEKCICKPGYERCDRACSLQLQPKTLDRILETECSNCGDCVVACTKMGRALFFKFPLGRELSRRVQLKGKIPILKKTAAALGCLVVFVGLGYLVVREMPRVKFSTGSPAIDNVLLSNKKIRWNDGRARYYEFLPDGTLICVGGDWPVEGFKGWQWESVDEKGSFKILQQASMPGVYAIARVSTTIGKGVSFIFEQYVDGKKVEGEEQTFTIQVYSPVENSHVVTATIMDARVILNRYADEVYILELTVQDPGGKQIKRILSRGDLITTEGMLTAVHRWINSPVITASEGGPPKLPIHTSMELRFRDGRSKQVTFLTDSIKNRSSEMFEDLWF